MSSRNHFASLKKRALKVETLMRQNAPTKKRKQDAVMREYLRIGDEYRAKAQKVLDELGDKEPSYEDALRVCSILREADEKKAALFN